ncbi:MAG: DinB family protein [Actinobacteria bacterium]|nr:DinB family protein [Actinomycetota bacterium]
MSLVPDDKDWTWVLERQCDECEFDASVTATADVAQMTRDASAQWVELLTTRVDVTTRPRLDVWSPLEYGCHVRDVYRVYTKRLRRMLNEDGPHYENWDQDKTAVEDRYSEQDPVAVAVDIRDEGTTLANLFDSIEGEQWERAGFRSDGAAFTIDTISRYFVHDVVHHLHDVGAP